MILEEAKKQPHKPTACCIVLSAILTALLTVGLVHEKFLENEYIQRFFNPKLAFAFFMFLVFLLLLVILREVINGVPEILETQPVRAVKPWKHFSLEFNRKGVMIAALLVFVCWIPWIILQYPCAMNGDTYNQLFQFQTHGPTWYTTMGYYVDGEYIDHHPVFDTLIYGSFLWVGQTLGNQNYGLFLFSIVQSALTAIALAASCCYLEKLGVPKRYRIVSLLFVALCPCIPSWPTNMVKDSTNALCFIGFFICYLEVFRSKGRAWKNKRFLLIFILMAGACILTKKTGIFIVGLSCLVLLIVYRKTWKQGLTMLLAPVLVFALLLPAIVYPAIGGVAPGGRQETLGALLQQTVTVLKESDNNVTADERQAVDNVLNTDKAIEKYRPEIVDNVKNQFKPDCSTADVVRYIGAWFTIGVKNPGAYAMSLERVNIRLLAPPAPLTYYDTCAQDASWIKTFESHSNDQGTGLSFDKPQKFKTAADAVQKVYTKVSLLPVINIFFCRGFYGSWIPLIGIFMAMFFKKRSIIAYVPVLACMVFLIMAPSASSRYIIPLLYATPLILGLVCYACQQAKADKEKQGIE